jgi:hypothetical protein
MASTAAFQEHDQERTTPPDATTTADGTQAPGTGEPPELGTAAPFQRLIAASDVVLGIAETNPRSMGGDAMARVVAAMLVQMERTLEEMKREIKSKDDEIRRLQGELSAATSKTDLMSERLGEQSTQQYVRGVLGVFGTWLFGLGMDQLKSSPGTVAYVLTGGGFLLGAYAIFGWPRRWRIKA